MNIPCPPFHYFLLELWVDTVGLSHFILHGCFFNTSFDSTFLGREGSCVFTNRSWKQLHVQIGEEPILTSRPAWAVLLENSLHEITTKQASTTVNCSQNIHTRTELNGSYPQLVLRSLTPCRSRQPGYHNTKLGDLGETEQRFPLTVPAPVS